MHRKEGGLGDYLLYRRLLGTVGGSQVQAVSSSNDNQNNN